MKGLRRGLGLSSKKNNGEEKKTRRKQSGEMFYPPNMSKQDLSEASSSGPNDEDASYSLEDHISFYSNRSYDPFLSAQHFFSVNSEVKIDNAIHSIVIVQSSIESLLSEKVRLHYPSLLRANEGIRSIGAEINDLSGLVNNTQQLLDVPSPSFTTSFSILFAFFIHSFISIFGRQGHRRIAV